jgi:hypothetical protein
MFRRIFTAAALALSIGMAAVPAFAAPADPSRVEEIRSLAVSDTQEYSSDAEPHNTEVAHTSYCIGLQTAALKTFLRVDKVLGEEQRDWSTEWQLQKLMTSANALTDARIDDDCTDYARRVIAAMITTIE